MVAMQQYKTISKIWSIFLTIILTLFIISFSIAIPIWFRPFYYLQVESLNIEEYSGFDKQTIYGAFNELMDYLNFNKPFGTGELPYSESGKGHFEDCKVLFDLDTYVCLACGIVLVAALILHKTKKLSPYRFNKFDLGFYAGILVIVIAVLLVILFAIDFDAAFEVFHLIFFPGKENWMFSWNADQIIRILPSDFFMNCGILIACVMSVLSVGAIVLGSLSRKKRLNQ